MKNLLASCFVLCTLLLNAQTPCVDGMAGIYPCDKIDLQTFMPLSELGDAPGVNDIWGWVDPMDSKEYALVGRTDALAFVDVTDPLNPIFLGHLPSTAGLSTWRDIKVFNNFAFIVADGSPHGLQVFDLTELRDVTNPPQTFEAGLHYTGFSNCHNIAMNEETGYLYPIGTNVAGGGPLFINMNDPLNPVLEGSYSDLGYSHDAQVVNYTGPDTEHLGKEIYFGFHGHSTEGLTIVDVTDKTDPEQISTTGYDCQDYTHQGWLSPDQRFCFINDELDEGTFGYNTRTRIFNVEDLDNPILIGNYISEQSSTDHNLYTMGTRAYLSNYTAGLRILDFSLLDSSIMEEVAFFDVHPSDNNVGYSGTWSNYPYFPSGNIVVTHRTTGLFILTPHDLDGIIPTQLINTEICPAEVSVEEFINTEFSLAPNPSTGVVTIESLVDLSQVFITDLSGRLVRRASITAQAGSRITLDLGSLEKGIYFISLNTLEGNAQRLIID